MKKQGLFITFEGTDGVGKTTQIRLLKKWLEKRGKKVRLTREPGGGPLSEKIRHLLLNPQTKIEPLTELLLYQVARVEHVEKVIRPALQSGFIVLCDRFTDATLAYQGKGRNLSFSTISGLNDLATGGVHPHITLLLDLPPHEGLKKAKARTKGKKGDRLEKEGVSFQKRVRQGYLDLAKRFPKRIRIIKVQPSIQDTQNQIRRALKKIFG